MTNRQLRNMMRDIAPRYQQKADARAAAAKHTARKSAIPAVIASAAVCCAALAAVIILPQYRQNGMTAAESAGADYEEVSAYTESSKEAPSAASPEFGDLTNTLMRFVAPAYAPCALEISPEEQAEIAKAFKESEWIRCDEEACPPDGESVSVYVYDPDKPLVLTFFSNQLVRISPDGFRDQGRLFTVSQAASDAVRKAARKDGESLLKHLTWCSQESLSTPKFWDNFSINPRECDMMTQDGLFFKMSNSIDYFGRVSGRILFGDAVDPGSAYSYAVQVSDFQYNLDMGTCYEDMTYYLGNNPDDMAESRFDTLQREGHMIYAADGTMIWQTSDDTEYKVTMGGSHRCEFGVPIENDQRHKIEDGMDFWDFRRGVSYGYTARESLFPENLSLGCLYDFDNWKIAGTAQLGGRTCTIVRGSLTGTYSKKLNAVTFEMYVDQETGILMQYKGYDADGRLGGFLITENMKFGEDADIVQSFDPTGLTKSGESLSEEMLAQVQAATAERPDSPQETAPRQTSAPAKSSTARKESAAKTTTATTVTTAKKDGKTYEERQKEAYDALLKRAVTDRPYDEVLHEEIADLYYFGYRWYPEMSYVDTPLSWNERHPVELLRKIDGNRMYGIQKMQQGGLLYTFYDNGAMTHTAWMSKALSYSDFDDIRIGDTSKKVAALEPVTEHWAFRAMATDSLHPVYDGFTQELLLKDGFLEIHYNMEKKPDYAVGDWIITDMKFYPDFKVGYDWGRDDPFVWDYSILPEDYPE